MNADKRKTMEKNLIADRAQPDRGSVNVENTEKKAKKQIL